MKRDDSQFEILGIDPTYEFERIVSAAADRLQFLAPSDSALKVVVRKGKDAVEASCRIASRAGEFFVEAVGESPLRAVQLIEKKMRQKLDQWKSSRFTDEE